MEDHQSFTSAWRMPRSEQLRIQQEYRKKKEGLEIENVFREEVGSVLEHYEAITGRRVNAEASRVHLHSYLKDGFECEDLCIFMQRQWEQNEYFKKNPDRFTIAVLFPLEAERREGTWDRLSYHQAERLKQQSEESSMPRLMGSQKLSLHCGCVILREQYALHAESCLKLKNPAWEKMSFEEQQRAVLQLKEKIMSRS